MVAPFGAREALRQSQPGRYAHLPALLPILQRLVYSQPLLTALTAIEGVFANTFNHKVKIEFRSPIRQGSWLCLRSFFEHRCGQSATVRVHGDYIVKCANFGRQPRALGIFQDLFHRLRDHWKG